MMLIIALTIGGEWFNTVPVGTFEGDVYWVQDYERPWDWEPLQPVGAARLTFGGGKVGGWMDLPRETVMWFTDVAYPVKFHDEKTPEEWPEHEWCPWLFRVLALGSKHAVRTGEFGQYNERNIHAEWLQGVSCEGFYPETGLRFRWRIEDGKKHVQAYGFWVAWPAFHKMSLGYDMYEVESGR